MHVALASLGQAHGASMSIQNDQGMTLDDLLSFRESPESFAATARALRRDADQGGAHAQFLLAVLLYEGHVGRREVLDGLALLRASAAQGHPAAAEMLARVTTDRRDQFLIGHALIYGFGAPADVPGGLRWVSDAATQGYAAAQELLGQCMLHGLGVAADPEAAIGWLRAAAKQDDNHAQYALYGAFKVGRGVARDEAEAMRWLRRAADGGNVSAAYALALALRDGAGVEQDAADAARRLAELVEFGHVSATEQLGMMYVDGVGVARDVQHGLSLLVRAKRDRGGW